MKRFFDVQQEQNFNVFVYNKNLFVQDSKDSNVNNIS